MTFVVLFYLLWLCSYMLTSSSKGWLTSIIKLCLTSKVFILAHSISSFNNIGHFSSDYVFSADLKNFKSFRSIILTPYCELLLLIDWCEITNCNNCDNEI